MFKKKTYRSVVEMTRDVVDDPAFADDLGKHIAERQLVRRLFALRCARGLSQQDVAVKMGCSQGRVSKLEASRDEDLSLRDIRSYAKALGLTTILGLEGGSTAVARVKFHHACIKRDLDALTKLAMTDAEIAEGVARFFDEAAFNFLRLLENATKTLPDEAQSSSVSVVMVGTGGDDFPDEANGPMPSKPKRSRKPKAKTN